LSISNHFELQWESPFLDYYWCHHFLHEVYEKGIVARVLGSQEEKWFATNDETGFQFYLEEESLAVMAEVGFRFLGDRHRVREFALLVNQLKERVDEIPWPETTVFDDTNIGVLEEMFHEAVGLHLCTQPHLMSKVAEELTRRLPAIVAEEERAEYVAKMITPDRLPEPLREQKEWLEGLFDLVSKASSPDEREPFIHQHWQRWKYLTAGDSGRPVELAELRERFEFDLSNLVTAKVQHDRLVKVESGIVSKEIETLEESAPSDIRDLCWAVRELGSLRFVTKQTWMKLWYCLEIWREQQASRLGQSVSGYLQVEINGGRIGGKEERNSYVLLRNGELASLFYNGLEVSIRKELLGAVPEWDGSPLHGTGGYQGVVSGRALVIGWGDDYREKGKLVGPATVLVVPQTTPQYIGMLTRCAALVTDEGGLAGHASIICRELKIPAVIGTRIATKVICDGDEIILDGNAGIVEVLKLIENDEVQN
jgi:phosphohistidine swiveling domain-containing protein